MCSICASASAAISCCFNSMVQQHPIAACARMVPAPAYNALDQCTKGIEALAQPRMTPIAGYTGPLCVRTLHASEMNHGVDG